VVWGTSPHTLKQRSKAGRQKIKWQIRFYDSNCLPINRMSTLSPTMFHSPLFTSSRTVYSLVLDSKLLLPSPGPQDSLLKSCSPQSRIALWGADGGKEAGLQGSREVRQRPAHLDPWLVISDPQRGNLDGHQSAMDCGQDWKPLLPLNVSTQTHTPILIPWHI
jgi:hypothetical protein